MSQNELPTLDRDLQRSIKVIAKGAGITFIGIIGGNLLGTVNQALLGRFLGVSDYGHFNLGLSVVNIAQAFAILGLSGGIARFIPFHLKKGEMAVVKSTIQFSLRFVFLLSLAIAAVLFLFSRPIAFRLFRDPSFHLVLKLFLLGFPLIVLPNVLQAIIRAFKAMGYKLFIFDLGMKIIRIAIFLLFIFFGQALPGAITAYFGGLFFALCSSLAVIRKKLFPHYRKYPRIPIAKRLLSFSWPLGLTGLTSLVETRSEVILMGYFLTSRDIGIFAPALVIAQMLANVSRSFEFIFLPVVSEFFARENKTQLAIVFKSVSKWLFIILLLALLFIIAFPKDIILLLYGKDYAQSWLPLIILAVGFAIGTSVSLAGNILVAAGHTKLSLASEIIGGVTSIVLNLVLIPRYRILGAAVAAGMSLTLRGLSSLLFAYRTQKIHPYNKDYIKILASGGAGLAVVLLLKPVLSPLMPWLVMFIGLAILLFLIDCGLLLATRVFDNNDRLVLAAVERRVGVNLGFIKKFI
jgi:O-antigen/teichoic acid export membrane protein